MSIYDISSYIIRVIVDSNYYEPTAKTPTQVEGTVLQLMIHGRHGEEMYNQGRVLDLIGNNYYEGECDVLVRFDNDVKNWLVGGTLILRSAKYGRMKSIWPGVKDIIFDERPFHELKPCTHYKSPESIWMTAHKKNYANVTPTPGVQVEYKANGTIEYTMDDGTTAVMHANDLTNQPGIIVGRGTGKTAFVEDFVVDAEIPLPPIPEPVDVHTTDATGFWKPPKHKYKVAEAEEAAIDLPDPDEQFNAEYGNGDDEIPY